MLSWNNFTVSYEVWQAGYTFGPFIQSQTARRIEISGLID